jgi:4-carboxymuconolactone decarboxylase
VKLKIPLPSDDQLPADIRETLANLPPVNVFRMMANAPASFHGFLQFAGSILTQSEFDSRKREIAILRVAHVTRASYEWIQHVRFAI